MPTNAIRRALIAVYDKSGVVAFARGLVEAFGVEIISTGGTARHLKESGVPVTLVEKITGFPEMLDGRVKTLHPRIFAGILADRDNPEHMRQLAEQGIEPIDMVIVNLYPFEQTVSDPECKFEDAIEMIDIGGPSLLRAAAKNHRHVLVVSDTNYERVLERLRGGEIHDLYEAGARHAFETTAGYDAAIAGWLAKGASGGLTNLRLWRLGALRYGENPHQTATLLRAESGAHALDLTAAAGGRDREEAKRWSYNNYVDADAALGLCAEIMRAPISARKALRCCVFVKHTNPCGVGVADDAIEAYRRAYLGDPNAAMGGILACSFAITGEFATGVMETYDRFGKAAGAGGFFVEVWLAPEFDAEALKVIRTAKKWGQTVRLLAIGDMRQTPAPDEMLYRSIAGGLLAQSADVAGLNEDEWTVVTKRAPNDNEISDLRLAWLTAKHTKSNAISICKDGLLIGNGAGQMSRVMSCRLATWLAKENGHAERLRGAVAASDGFFPFRDGPELLIGEGVRAIIQPGGSKRDAEVIAACDERDVAMIFTGVRHFRH